MTITAADLMFDTPLGVYSAPSPIQTYQAPEIGLPQITGLPGGSGNLGAGTPLGFNLGTAQMALSGLNTLGNLWGAFQSMGLAKKQFKFTKDFAETNLANQIKSYNTSLADRARSRGVMEGQSSAETQNYIDQNSLSRKG